MHQLDAILFQLVGNRAEYGVSVFFLQPHQHPKRAKIGPQVKEVFWRVLSRARRIGGRRVR